MKSLVVLLTLIAAGAGYFLDRVPEQRADLPIAITTPEEKFKCEVYMMRYVRCWATLGQLGQLATRLHNDWQREIDQGNCIGLRSHDLHYHL
jgi:hypothetical protein